MPCSRTEGSSFGGNFNTFNGVGRNGIARLNDDGLLDLTFNPGSGANNVVNSVTVQGDGKVLVGGMFTFMNNILVNRIARLRADGSIDPSFDMGTTVGGAQPGANNTVNTVTVTVDGRILLGGAFTSINGLTRNYLARVQGVSNPTGGLIEFASSSYTVAETNPVAVISLKRSGNIGSQVRVSYVATNGTADGGDFISVSNTLTFTGYSS